MMKSRRIWYRAREAKSSPVCFDFPLPFSMFLLAMSIMLWREQGCNVEEFVKHRAECGVGFRTFQRQGAGQMNWQPSERKPYAVYST